jgi:CubicO group peptidase (beta-lactamase class C family)
MPLALAIALFAPARPAPAFQEAPAAADLTARLEAIRESAKLPALGGALVTLDGLQGVWVTGNRRADGTERVTAQDQWHLGSCTKSMTATLVALLVTRGDLAWETVLGDFFPELAGEMNEAYLDVTLLDLLGHRAGVPNDPHLQMLAELDTSKLSLSDQREKVVAEILKQAPVHPPHGAFLYSNFGFVIAGHIAERATGKSWETLLQELLFEPLGMTSAGFGAPGTSERCDQPRGHSPTGEPVEPGPGADNSPVIGPAGTVHASLADWAKYVALHLAGSRGDVKVGAITLTADTFALLHRPREGPGQGYALGWVVDERPWAGGDGTALWHNGSNTLWYCVTWLGPGNGVGVLVTTNRFTPAAQSATDQVAGLLLKEYERRGAEAKTR